MYSEILYDVDDPVATITLNRPHALNAWTPTMESEVKHAFREAERDPSVVGILLTGAGRGFCAGADLAILDQVRAGSLVPGIRGLTADDTTIVGESSWGDDLRGAYTYMMSIPKPTIAVINGAVAGMGLPIALGCDLRFMAEDAVLVTAFAERGLIAEQGVSWLLSRLAGPAVALDLLLSSRKIDGREAEHLRIVNRSFPAGDLLDAAREYVVAMADRCSPASMAVIKRQVLQQTHRGLGSAQHEAVELMLQSFAQADFAEGVESFLERRPAVFGRLPATSPNQAGG